MRYVIDSLKAVETLMSTRPDRTATTVHFESVGYMDFFVKVHRTQSDNALLNLQGSGKVFRLILEWDEDVEA